MHNDGSTPWQGGAWLQWQSRYTAPHTSMFSSTRYDYQKAALYGTDGYQEQEFTALAEKPLNATVNGGWIAVVDHYFLAAIIPADAQGNQYYSRSLGDSRFVTGSLMPPKSVAPGASASFDGRLFVGPKLQTLLASVTKGLELTVDYGKLTIIAQPIFWVLEHIEKLVGNWGWSILILTLLFKALTYKLNEISGRSMAKMRLVQPRIKALQERYAGDRQRLSQAMMELYKKEKINPASGCFPILIQIPIFFSLYYVLVYSVGAAPDALDPVDTRPVGAGSLVRAAAAVRRRHVHPAAAAAAAYGQDPGHDDEIHARGADLPLYGAAGGPGAVLLRQLHHQHRPAALHQ